MLAAVRSAAVLGVDAFDVTVEVDCTRGLPQWTVVGMPASSVKESRERVASALTNSGVQLPPQYSHFGQVVKGLEVIDAMQRVETDRNDRPREDVVINSVTITVAD